MVEYLGRCSVLAGMHSLPRVKLSAESDRPVMTASGNFLFKVNIAVMPKDYQGWPGYSLLEEGDGFAGTI